MFINIRLDKVTTIEKLTFAQYSGRWINLGTSLDQEIKEVMRILEYGSASLMKCIHRCSNSYAEKEYSHE